MKKISLFLALVTFVSMSFATSINNFGSAKDRLYYATETIKQKQHAAITTTSAEMNSYTTLTTKAGKTIYGYCIFDTSWGQTDKSGLYSFDADAPTSIKLERKQTIGVSAGAYYDGYFYLQTSEVTQAGEFVSIDFLKVNNETGEATHIMDWMGKDGGFFSDMTYDYSTNTLFGVMQVSQTGSIICSIDTETGAIDTEQTAETAGVFIGLAASSDGTIYSVDAKGNLVTLTTDGTKTVIGKTGVTPKYLQSMDFDQTEGTLYWAMCNSGDEGKFGTIDITTGKFTSNGTLGGDAEFVALYVPSGEPSDEKFVVTIDTPANGNLEVKNGTTVINSGDMVRSGTTLTIKTTPNEGYKLNEIKVNGVTITGTTCKVTAATTISAIFGPNVGVNDNEIVKFNIYPNPVSEVMNITGDFTSVNIYNSVGQCVGTYSVEEAKINVSNLSEGVYMVRVYNGDIFSTRKVIIKK